MLDIGERGEIVVVPVTRCVYNTKNSQREVEGWLLVGIVNQNIFLVFCGRSSGIVVEVVLGAT